ncbi:PREDICTED: GDSL esterase/lipase At2g03980-like isoform X2 [Camelina sativa]|nr:PREDICTED: GDSL esterase/lipase At2g03980-like isoform X2 [Camelina sativa]
MGFPSFPNSCFLLILLCLVNISTISSTEPLKQEAVLFGGNFPALYVIGDSLVDAGNNNNLETSVKSNYPPYGSDFEGGKATGRFSNGKTIADYIAMYYGLPLVPAYMGLSEEQKNNISTGINYASASCGILFNTGKRVGQCLSLSVQVDLFQETIEKNLKTKFKNPSELSEHLAQSLFMIAIGVNDYASIFRKTPNFNATEFADKLLQEYLIQIERLHTLGAKKFFINNVKPLGCYPNMIVTSEPRGSCNEPLNLAIGLFNTKLRNSLSQMKQKFNDTAFLYSDYYNYMLGLRGGTSSNQAGSSPLNSTAPCCPEVYDGAPTTTCWPSSIACKEPDTHIFFDPFHPTQLANYKYSIACFNERSICHVVNN